MISKRLERGGVSSTAIHGNKSQNARQRALEAFRRKQVQVLVATDVAARGIDIDGITHVVNFDLPDEPEGYVHRVGRTGRAGAKGTALSFCSESERGKLRAIEKLIGESLVIELRPSQVENQKRHSHEQKPTPRRRTRVEISSLDKEASTRRTSRCSKVSTALTGNPDRRTGRRRRKPGSCKNQKLSQ